MGMKHLALSILLLAAIVAASCIDPDAAFGPKKPVDLSAANITKTSCDAEHACPEGLVCFNFPAKSVPLCATPGPCAYYP